VKRLNNLFFQLTVIRLSSPRFHDEASKKVPHIPGCINIQNIQNKHRHDQKNECP
jgi:hypothetical protein